MPDFLLEMPAGQAVCAVILIYVLGPFAVLWLAADALRLVRLAWRGRS